jgi:hypothetical protein
MKKNSVEPLSNYVGGGNSPEGEEEGMQCKGNSLSGGTLEVPLTLLAAQQVAARKLKRKSKKMKKTKSGKKNKTNKSKTSKNKKSKK